MADYAENIGDDEKVKIACDFIVHSPPGEVETVMKDVRVLLNNGGVNNDVSFDDRMLSALAQFRIDQFTPVNVDDNKVLITNHGALDDGRFLDPSTNKSFKFNVLSKVVSDIQQEECDSGIESWRHEIEISVREYVKNYYPHGVTTVYGKNNDNGKNFVICIEDHKFCPQNFWNGRWRSEWNVTVDNGSASVTGLLKSQVHYYENGNVQLVSKKECKDTLTVTNEKRLAEDVSKLLAKCEQDYQYALSENYNSMSSTTFKALRRILPITQNKLDWNKLLSYEIGRKLNK